MARIARRLGPRHPRGYEFSGWSGDYTGTENPLTLTNVTSAKTIQANFSQKRYEVIFTAGAGGSLLGDASQTVVHGEDCTAVRAEASEGYEFSGWSGDYTGTANPLTLTNVTSAKTIQANFRQKTYTIAFTAGNGGTLIGDVNQRIVHGNDCTAVSVRSRNGYQFSGWSGDYTGSESRLTVKNVTSDMTIRANFQLEWHLIEFVAEIGGSLSGETSQKVVHGGDSSEVTAEPLKGYEFSGWSDDYTGTENPLTVTNVLSAMDIQANFIKKIYTMTFTAGKGGSLTGDTSQKVVHGGDSSEVTAEPSAGYEFSGWSGDYTGTENPLTVTNVVSAMNIQTNFTQKTYTVTFTAGKGGSLTGDTSQKVVHGGDSSEVTAVASECFNFTGWHGDYEGRKNSLALSGVESDMHITATFSPTDYTVTFNTENGGRLKGNTNQIVECRQNATPVEALPKNENFYFKRWLGDYRGDENPLTLENVTRNLTVTAHFIDVRNQAPEKPNLLYPANNAVITKADLDLKWSAYNDPEADPLMRLHVRVCRIDDPSWCFSDSFDTEMNSLSLSGLLEDGLRYVWWMGYKDTGSELTSWSARSEFTVGESTMDNNLSVKPGNTLADYRMVSFVQWHSPARVVFGPLLTTDYGEGRYKIGIYDPNKGSGGYREYPNFSVAPGQAYWVLAADGMDFRINGVPVSLTTDIYVQLKFNPENQTGWNMIGCPNQAVYHWGDIEVVKYNAENEIIFGPMPIAFMTADNPYIDIRIWEWQEGLYKAHSDNDFSLLPYTGYWVKVKQAGVALCFPFDMQVETPGSSIAQAGRLSNWKEWVLDRVPKIAIAHADMDEDSPPMPMAAFDLNENEVGSQSGCFVETGAVFR